MLSETTEQFVQSPCDECGASQQDPGRNLDGMATSRDPLAWQKPFCRGQYNEQEGEEDRRRDVTKTSKNGQ